MEYYAIHGDQVIDICDGEFRPFPDLDELILTDSVIADLHVEVTSGTALGDMFFAAFNVVSPRFIDTLKKCGATGYAAMPIPIKKNGRRIGDFFVLKLLGRGGAFDESRSHVRRSPDGSMIWGYSNVQMNESDWDGSDIFAIPGLGYRVFAVERVAAILEKKRLSNVVVTRHDLVKSGLWQSAK